MKVYLAGLVHTVQMVESAGTPNEIARAYHAQKVGMPLLESYVYLLKDSNHRKKIERFGARVFLDSGAFTAFTKKIKVDLREYATWIQRNHDLIEYAANFDEIGVGKERQSYDNWRLLAKMGAKTIPVHHARDHDDWLLRYLDEGVTHLALGGMVPESTEYLRTWLDRIWSRYLTHPDGSPRIKVHGFGMTVVDLMTRYPWYSVDSTSWVLISRYGSILIDLPGGDLNVVFSSRSPEMKKAKGRHYLGLSNEEKKALTAQLDRMNIADHWLPADIALDLETRTGLRQGFFPETLADMYAWRDLANILFFKRLQGRGIKKMLIRPGYLF